MATMDLRTNQEVMAVQNRYSTEYGSHAFKIKENFKETDIKGNNNLFNYLKTEASSNHDHDPSSLFQVKCQNKNNLEVDNSLFSYSSFKKAMDLRTHNRTAVDEGKRTIFEDAEYFAKNHCYKLLPITFEQVDETIIQSEHNYFLSSMTSESEAEEDCSRMMDYTQIKEKNYKKRTKLREGKENRDTSETPDGEGINGISSSMLSNFTTITEQENALSDNSSPVQPLDLSAAPLVQDEKTEPPLREHPSNIAEKDEIVQPDSDKENMNSELKGILVTITRPDEIQNYQPCDLFLNDIARLVPWLIDKDCFEVDILDRTCDRSDDEFRKDRLYYVISESTWRLFQKTNERVILTNDQSLGQPLKKVMEKEEKPSYLVFDQFSLAKCLAEYSKEIGGCFEYTCIEEGKNEGCMKRNTESTVNEKEEVKVPVEGELETGKNREKLKEEDVSKKREEGLDEVEEKAEENEDSKQITEVIPEGDDMDQKTTEPLEEEEVLLEKEKISLSGLENVTKEKVGVSVFESETVPSKEVENCVSTGKEIAAAENEKSSMSLVKPNVSDNNSKTVSAEHSVSTSETVAPKELEISVPKSEKNIMPSKKTKKSRQKPKNDKADKKKKKESETASVKTKDSKKDTQKQPIQRLNPVRKSSIQPKPKIPWITTRSKSTSESETSQKSDKPVNKRRKRGGSALLNAEPPKKVKKPANTEVVRKTRSGKVLEEVKTEKPTAMKKESAGPKPARKKIRGRSEVEGTGAGRCLRSQKMTPKSKPKDKR